MTTPQLPVDLIRKIMSYDEIEPVLSFDEFKIELKHHRNLIINNIAECQKEYITRFHKNYYDYVLPSRIQFRVNTYTLEDSMWAQDYMTKKGWNVKINRMDSNYPSYNIEVSQTF